MEIRTIMTTATNEQIDVEVGTNDIHINIKKPDEAYPQTLYLSHDEASWLIEQLRATCEAFDSNTDRR